MVRVARNLLICLALVWFAGCGNTVSDAEHIERAQAYLDTGDLNAAAIELKNVLAQNQDNPQARRQLGIIHFKTGNFAGAEKELRRASGLGVADDAVLPLLARALLAQGNYEDLDALSVAQMSGTARAEVLAAQGLGRLAANKPDEAAKLIGQALTLSPDSSYVGVAHARLLAATEKRDEAVQALEQLLQRDANFAPAWNLLGDLHRTDKKLAEAETAYAKAIENRVANTLDYLGRAMVRIDLGEYEAAQKDVDVLRQRIPKHPSVNYAQGLIYLHRNKLEDAKNAFEQALKGDRRGFLTKYYLSLVNLSLGNIQQADDYAEQAFAARPVSVGVRELLAVIKLKQGGFAKAEELVRPIVEHRKEDVQAIDLLASALLGQKKIEEALPLLEKVVAMRPQSATAEMRYGAALLKEKHPKEGVAHLRASIDKDPALRQSRLLLVRYYQDQKQMDKAMQVAREYQQAEPKRALPLNLMGGLLLQAGDEQAAAASFEQARTLEPGDPDASYALAGLAIKAKDYKKARDYYEDVLAHHEGHLATLIKLALLDGIEKKEPDMLAHLKQAMAANPKVAVPRVMLGRYYLLKGQPGKVAPLFVELDDTQKNAPAVLEVMAFAQLAQKEYRDAEYNLKQLLKVRSDSAQLHFLLARAYGGQNDAAAMKKELERTVELAPKHLAARLALTRFALLQKDMSGAEAQLVELEKMAPEHPDVLYLKAALVDREGNREVAANLLEDVFEKVPNTKTMLSLARQKWAMGNPEEALALQEQWTQQHPDDAMATLALAGTLSAQGELDKAVGEYEALLQKDDKNIVALNDLAWHLRDKEPARALEYAERANALAPDTANVLDTLAMVQLSNKQYERAKRSIERALAKAPKNPSFQYHSAVIQSAAGEKEQALRTLNKALQGKADFPEKKDALALLARLRGE